MILDLTGSTAIRRRMTALRPILLHPETGLFVADDGSGSMPVLYDLSGRRRHACFRRAQGGWRLDEAGENTLGTVLSEQLKPCSFR